MVRNMVAAIVLLHLMMHHMMTRMMIWRVTWILRLEEHHTAATMLVMTWGQQVIMLDGVWQRNSLMMQLMVGKAHLLGPISEEALFSHMPLMLMRLGVNPPGYLWRICHVNWGGCTRFIIGENGVLGDNRLAHGRVLVTAVEVNWGALL